MKDNIDQYFDKPYWIIDILPKQVPANSKGQYFKVEQYFLNHPELLYPKFSGTLIKLNCYEDFELGVSTEEWIQNPNPETIEKTIADSFMEKKSLLIELKSAKALITFNGDDHYMTVYNPNATLLKLLKALAASEGLFIWRPQNHPKL